MKKRIKDGGPAFPGPYVNDKGGLEAVWKQGGMTLRDWFAGRAMQSIMRFYDMQTSFEDDEVNDPEGMPTLIAIDAYIMADAMLKAREK